MAIPFIPGLETRGYKAAAPPVLGSGSRTSKRAIRREADELLEASECQGHGSGREVQDEGSSWLAGKSGWRIES